MGVGVRRPRSLARAAAAAAPEGTTQPEAAAGCSGGKGKTVGWGGFHITSTLLRARNPWAHGFPLLHCQANRGLPRTCPTAGVLGSSDSQPLGSQAHVPSSTSVPPLTPSCLPKSLPAPRIAFPPSPPPFPPPATLCCTLHTCALLRCTRTVTTALLPLVPASCTCTYTGCAAVEAFGPFQGNSSTAPPTPEHIQGEQQAGGIRDAPGQFKHSPSCTCKHTWIAAGLGGGGGGVRVLQGMSSMPLLHLH